MPYALLCLCMYDLFLKPCVYTCFPRTVLLLMIFGKHEFVLDIWTVWMFMTWATATMNWAGFCRNGNVFIIVRLSTHLSTCLSASLYVYLCIYVSVNPSIKPFPMSALTYPLLFVCVSPPIVCQLLPCMSYFLWALFLSVLTYVTFVCVCMSTFYSVSLF